MQLLSVLNTKAGLGYSFERLTDMLLGRGALYEEAPRPIIVDEISKPISLRCLVGQIDINSRLDQLLFEARGRKGGGGGGGGKGKGPAANQAPRIPPGREGEIASNIHSGGGVQDDPPPDAGRVGVLTRATLDNKGNIEISSGREKNYEGEIISDNLDELYEKFNQVSYGCRRHEKLFKFARAASANLARGAGSSLDRLRAWLPEAVFYLHASKAPTDAVISFGREINRRAGTYYAGPERSAIVRSELEYGIPMHAALAVSAAHVTKDDAVGRFMSVIDKFWRPTLLSREVFGYREWFNKLKEVMHRAGLAALSKVYHDELMNKGSEHSKAIEAAELVSGISPAAYEKAELLKPTLAKRATHVKLHGTHSISDDDIKVIISGYGFEHPTEDIIRTGELVKALSAARPASGRSDLHPQLAANPRLAGIAIARGVRRFGFNEFYHDPNASDQYLNDMKAKEQYSKWLEAELVRREQVKQQARTVGSLTSKEDFDDIVGRAREIRRGDDQQTGKVAKQNEQIFGACVGQGCEHAGLVSSLGFGDDGRAKLYHASCNGCNGPLVQVSEKLANQASESDFAPKGAVNIPNIPGWFSPEQLKRAKNEWIIQLDKHGYVKHYIDE